jgi:hypothetical protein
VDEGAGFDVLVDRVVLLAIRFAHAVRAPRAQHPGIFLVAAFARSIATALTKCRPLSRTSMAAVPI